MLVLQSLHMCMLSHFSHGQLFSTQWTVACQTPLSMGFSRQEYWSGLPCAPSEYLPDPGIKPISPAAPALQVDSLSLSHWGNSWKAWVLPKTHEHQYCQNFWSIWKYQIHTYNTPDYTKKISFTHKSRLTEKWQARITNLEIGMWSIIWKG